MKKSDIPRREFLQPSAGAPVGSLRPSEPSINITSPRTPFATNSFAFAQMTE